MRLTPTARGSAGSRSTAGHPPARPGPASRPPRSLRRVRHCSRPPPPRGHALGRPTTLADNNATNLDWGMAAAPLIVDDTVVVLPGGPGGRSVAAYRRATGELVWTSLDDRQAYTSPMLVTLGGMRQILVVSAARVMGVTTDQGRLLWEYPWVTNMGINVAQPVLLDDDRVFISACYD